MSTTGKPSSTRTVWKGDMVTPEMQADLGNFREIVIPDGSFAHSAGSRLEMTEVEVYKRERDGKAQLRVTYELLVTPDMLNHTKTLHGGCSVYLIDVCSSVALAALAVLQGKPSQAVSQTLITTFHAPAPVGAKIEIVNTTISLGGRVASAITEIWDATNRRLCVTGIHNKMAPSTPTARL
ncbi:HotDog domain-containing protein [Daedaleopsis nitida]|nr:HotDog domain-containing protein [Daedaleopsis nitida]